MAFREDFLNQTMKERVARHRMVSDGTWRNVLDYHKQESDIFWNLALCVSHAKIIKMPGAQADIFLNLSIIEGQDYKWLRLPFPSIYLPFNPPFIFTDYKGEIDHGGTHPYIELEKDPATVRMLYESLRSGYKKDPIVKACQLTDVAIDKEDKKPLTLMDSRQFLPRDIDRMIQVAFFIPLPDFFFNIHLAVILVLADGRLEYANSGTIGTRNKMAAFAVHCINFLNSPSVKLLRREHTQELQKARNHRGKEPLPGWYEIAYRREIGDYSRAKVSEKQFHHSFRYDVRGHFKQFTKGPVAGRVIWCPPHQRGLKNELYKPKVYVA